MACTAKVIACIIWFLSLVIPPPAAYWTQAAGHINSFRPVGMFISVSQQFLPVTGLFITNSLILGAAVIYKLPLFAC